MRTLDVVSADGVFLDAVLHPAKADPVGTVVQAHGITVDKDEGGMFVRLAETLSDRGFDVIRFSYRGHGKSGGTPPGDDRHR
jgi:predicted alpha/beta hydrolase